MSRAKKSSDARFSALELVRLTFPDRAALEREIATNLRYGQVFVSESLKFPVLTDGVVVIVHPATRRELRLPAQIVLVNAEGPHRGTGLALRAFGPVELEQLEAFAREPGTAGSAASAPTRASSGVQRVAAQPIAAARAGDRKGEGPRALSSTANTAVSRPVREVDATATRPRSNVRQRPAQEVDGRNHETGGSALPPQTTSARTASRITNPAVRRPAQEINRVDAAAEPVTTPPPMAASADPTIGVPSTAVRAQASPSTYERRASSPADLADSADVEADDWSDFEHEPDVPPTAKQTGGGGVPQPAPLRGDDDWSDFEQGLAYEPATPDAVMRIVEAERSPVAAREERESTIEADASMIPYDLESARARAPSAAFVSNPHTAVTHRPPPKDASGDEE